MENRFVYVVFTLREQFYAHCHGVRHITRARISLNIPIDAFVAYLLAIQI